MQNSHQICPTFQISIIFKKFQISINCIVFQILSSVKKSRKLLNVAFIYIDLDQLQNSSNYSKFRFSAEIDQNIFSFYTDNASKFLTEIEKTKYTGLIKKVMQVCEHYLMSRALGKQIVGNSTKKLPSFFTNYYKTLTNADTSSITDRDLDHLKQINCLNFEDSEKSVDENSDSIILADSTVHDDSKTIGICLYENLNFCKQN